MSNFSKPVSTLSVDERKELLEEIRALYAKKIPDVLLRRMYIPATILRRHRRDRVAKVIYFYTKSSAHDLLLSFNYWDETPQGVEFWSDMAELFSGKKPNNNQIREIIRKYNVA